MIIGIGCDSLDISRIEKIIEKSEEAFVAKILTASEQKTFESSPKKPAFLAKRFAAKEATLKALGTGLREGLSWQDIEISNNELGRPLLSLTGGCLEQAKSLLTKSSKLCTWISLSDTDHIATAMVILEGVE